MSDNGPDGIFGIDADDASPPNIKAVLIYHDGGAHPPIWEKMGGPVSEAQFDDLKSEANDSQSAFNTEAGSIWGGQYNGKPPGAKVAIRNAFKNGLYPVA